MCAHLNMVNQAFYFSSLQGDRLASMVDGPTKRAMLVIDMDRGRSIHVPAQWPVQKYPKTLLFLSLASMILYGCCNLSLH